MARVSDFLEYENSKECCPLISEYIKRIWEKIPSKREMMDSACGFFAGSGQDHGLYWKKRRRKDYDAEVAAQFCASRSALSSA